MTQTFTVSMLRRSSHDANTIHDVVDVEARSAAEAVRRAWSRFTVERFLSVTLAGQEIDRAEWADWAAIVLPKATRNA